MLRVPDFSSISVVVGDLIAVQWIHAQSRRLSRESPVMILRHRHERLAAGGAASLACVVRVRLEK
jgi:bifunctional ADP-heptose synthase (sugar kinase/adenylyltransferase)